MYMLIQLKVANFLSIKDEVTFSMVASGIKEHIDTNVFNARKDLKLLKSAGIYGANASGKSNLFQAMKFMRYFILNSSKNMQSGEKIRVERFKLSSETDSKASLFEIIFISDNKRYRYGFEVNQSNVVCEWLYYLLPSKKKEEMLFYREDDKYELGKAFTEGKGLESKTRKNALFLSVAAQFNGTISESVVTWFMNLSVVSGLNQRYEIMSDLLVEDKKLKNKILEYLRIADMGIEDIVVEKQQVDLETMPKEMHDIFKTVKTLMENQEVPTVTSIKMLHKKYDPDNNVISLEQFDMERSESEGTKKLFSLLAPVVNALTLGTILVVDELDSSLHPLITLLIIQLFNSNQYNPLNAQLIFNTHDTNLLSKKTFRRDQIWFAEKNKFGASTLYSLIEFNVRYDASFEKDYLQGRYGSIPFIGQLDFDCELLPGEGDSLGN